MKGLVGIRNGSQAYMVWILILILILSVLLRNLDCHYRLEILDISNVV